MHRSPLVFVVSAIILSVTTLGMSACSSITTPTSTTDPDRLSVQEVDRPGGGTVECVFWLPVDNSGTGAQMDCNWDAAGSR